MRHVQTLGQNGASVRQMPDVSLPAAVAPTVKEIPYDYVATFTLQGRPGNRVQDVINISVEGAFVAVAIGYSLIPPRLPDLLSQPQRDQILTQWVTNQLALLGTPGTFGANIAPISINRLLEIVQPVVDLRMVLPCLLERLCGIDFKYSIIDSSTGRELQNKAIHSIAGLGEPTGHRPFRPFAKPMLFMPRSTIRIEVEEVAEGLPYGYSETSGRRIGAELFIVLHGYKMLGYGTGSP